MHKVNTDSTSEKLVQSIVEGIQEKKGLSISTIDLRRFDNSLSDYFVICHGTSDRQVEAIADSIVEITMKQLDEKPSHKEGYANSEWILLDYVDVIVHVFREEIREAYSIEKLWADAPIKEYA